MTNNQIPGLIVGNRLVKRVTRNRHLLRCVQGYAWSIELLKWAEARGVRVLELVEDTGQVLCVSLDYVKRRGKRFQFGAYEPQVGIPETAMTVLDPRQGELFGGMV